MSEKGTGPLLSVSDAAALAGMPRSTFYRLIRAAAVECPELLVDFPGVRLLVRRRALERWLAGDDCAGEGGGEMAAAKSRLRAV